MQIVKHRAYSRVGLIGNPSDGYGGKTIAFTLRNFHAEVVLYPWDQLEIMWSEQDRIRFDSIDELVEDVDLNGYYGGVRLVKATIKRFAEYCRANGVSLDRDPFSVRYTTDIPRGVGLSGSSAIVVATLRCLLEYYETQIDLPVLASVARSVENDELGIACGYQDRVAQVYQGLVYMDFSRMVDVRGYPCGQYARLDASFLPPVYLIYDVATSKTSQSVHGPLRTRVQDNQRLSETIERIANLVPQARQAIQDRDANRLHELLNENFDLRLSLYPIRPQHQAMIETARSVGASAKFAGSGGSVVGIYRDERMYLDLQQALADRCCSWRIIKPEIAPPVETASP
ncbi:MAG: mevalonate kinase [Pirellulaceae bacterium]